jgi:acyl dehydratase
MAIQYPQILERVTPEQTWTWTDRDFMLYALCVGLNDPSNPRTLPFVYEHELKMVPTMPTILAWVGEPTFANLGVDPITALHGEQRIELHRPIPCPVTMRVRGRVLSVHDKGIGRGAIVITQHTITDAANTELLATLTTACFGRSEGGCGDHGIPAPRPHSPPERAPDLSLDFPTQPELALLYRLTGDRNPLHADPDVARRAGFERPILHGLCGFGVTSHAVLKAYTNYDPRPILSHQARFAAPIFAGDTLTVDLWRDREIVSFEARVKARQVTVIKNGKCVLFGTRNCGLRPTSAIED